jgi:hypothetical protein
MAGMHARRPSLATLRQDTAPLLLLVFLLGAVLSPALHLAVHRDDHSHGVGAVRTHAAAHRAGLAHEHPDAPADDERTPDHGRDSSAHFGLALLQALPASELPRPAEALLRRAAAAPGRPRPPVIPQQPVRGPPPASRISPLMVVDS